MSGSGPDPTSTEIVPVGLVPSSLDGQFTVLAPVPGTGWAGQQPPFPTVWPPPPPAPGPSLAWAGSVIPWKQWIQAMAVRPFVTDPPPCPVVVSRYPGLTNN